MRVSGLAMLGLFALAGCRPVTGLRAASTLQTQVAPDCVAEAVRTTPGIVRTETRERRRDGAGVLEVRYFREGSFARLFLVTGAASQRVILSETWLVGLGPEGSPASTLPLGYVHSGVSYVPDINLTPGEAANTRA